ncbi:MAG TPA: radical SAM family heme chaperone HemW [Pyrinomonadaceae bacterium]|jgi:oxygen-independent coproporphyrinogen-3 oxidase|nr:radical SAM family heme chaperone HemW [Pyrinomonadaceae bacterium]
MQHAGIYLHIPFCRSRCSYCDFATQLYANGIVDDFVAALVAEINAWHPPHDTGRRIFADTIYFGGGTPSLLDAGQTARILDAVAARFDIAPDAEITMEMNPGTVTPSVLRSFRALGVNRASFGAQTFDDHELRRLGRSHTAEDARRTLHDLRDAGFDNISLDLIAGLPAQTPAAWESNLDEALALRPDHLSLYLLEIHEGTPLAEHVKRGLQKPISEDSAAEMYETMVERVGAIGYRQYEISNFALPHCESRHNTKYWTGAPVYGFGSSAHSYDGEGTRWANERDAANYIKSIRATNQAVVERTPLTPRELSAETIFLGLRLLRGVDLGAYRARFGSDPRATYGPDLDRLRDAGLIELNDDTLRLTPAGALLSNEVFAVFV